MAGSTSGLKNIKQFKLRKLHILEAVEHMRAAGEEGVEGVALWVGEAIDETFVVRETLIPHQRGLKTPSGLLYVVDSSELHRINVYLYRHGLTLGAQIHSHPGEAYHSATDDEYAIVTVVGGISIVVPYFAAGPVDPGQWAVYRLTASGAWNEVQTPGSELIYIVE